MIYTRVPLTKLIFNLYEDFLLEFDVYLSEISEMNTATEINTTHIESAF